MRRIAAAPCLRKTSPGRAASVISQRRRDSRPSECVRRPHRGLLIGGRRAVGRDRVGGDAAVRKARSGSRSAANSSRCPASHQFLDAIAQGGKRIFGLAALDLDAGAARSACLGHPAVASPIRRQAGRRAAEAFEAPFRAKRRFRGLPNIGQCRHAAIIDSRSPEPPSARHGPTFSRRSSMC